MIRIKSGIELKVKDEKGKVKTTYHDNVLTNDGRNVMLRKMANIDGYGNDIIATHIEVGDTEQEPEVTSFDLGGGTVTALKAAEATYDLNSRRLQFACTFSGTEGNFTWNTAGLWRVNTTPGNLLIGIVSIDPPQRKISGDSAMATWQISFEAGS